MIMLNDTMLIESVPSDQTSFLLSELFCGHPMPNTVYTVNIYAVNVAGAGPSLTDNVILPPSPNGTYTYVLI